jgi:hypothetical protein
VWTNVVERGRKCQMCRHFIEAGEPSFRYIRDDIKYSTFNVSSEKAICKNCALPILERMVADLKKPRDEQLFLRMKRNQPQPKTEW